MKIANNFHRKHIQTRHVSGSIYDYALYKRSHPKLSKGVTSKLGLGYFGVEKDYPGLGCMLPFKKKNPGRGKKGVKAESLIDVQKLFDMLLVLVRVVVEHTNSGVKKFRVFGVEFGNRLKIYDSMIEIVCGIVNFRILGSLAI